MLAATDFGNYGLWSAPLISSDGADIDLLIDILHYFMVVAFFAWGAFFVYCLFRFRKRAGIQATYQFPRFKTLLFGFVAFVAVFELYLDVGITNRVWARVKNPPAENTDMEVVRVLGQQFQWNIHYPGPDGVFGRTDASLIDTASNPIGLDEDDPNAKDDVWKVNEFHLPTGKTIYVRLTSMDVIHSFAIPTMRIKQDVIPGMEIPVWFKIDEDATTENLKASMTKTYPIGRASWYKLRHLVSTEDYKDRSGQVILAVGDGLGATRVEGTELIEKLRAAGVEELSMQPRSPIELICSQLCGNSHYTMHAKIVTHTPDGFAQWLKEQSKEVEFDEDF